jgi:hypothetical protein
LEISLENKSYTSIEFSKHVVSRMSQRNLSKDDVIYVICNGRKVQNAGVTHHFLGKKDILVGDRSNDEITRLEGTVVLSDFHASNRRLRIITVYRNRGAFRKLLRKTKYNKKTCYGDLPLAG